MSSAPFTPSYPSLGTTGNPDPSSGFLSHSQASNACPISDRPISIQSTNDGSTTGVCVQYAVGNMLVQLQDVSTEMAEYLSNPQIARPDVLPEIDVDIKWPGVLSWLKTLIVVTGLVLVERRIYIMARRAHQHAEFEQWREMRIDQIVLERRARAEREARRERR
jgi:hypothetical protein